MLKKLIFSFICVMTFSFLSAQVTPTKLVHPEATQDAAKDGGPVMSFESTDVDYGVIKQHGEPLRVLSFTNTGDEPLVIKNCKGSCGCTVPTWPKEPIMPGETNKIEVRYATNRLGKINKTIRITTNEGTNPHVIKVLGEVLKAEDEESVPTTQPTMLSGGTGGQ